VFPTPGEVKVDMVDHIKNDAMQAKSADAATPRAPGGGAVHEDSAEFKAHNEVYMAAIGRSERKFLTDLIGDEGLQVKFSRNGDIGTRSTARLTTFAKRLGKAYPPPVLQYPLVITGRAKRAAKVQAFLESKGVTNRFRIVPKASKVRVTVDDYTVTPRDDVGSQMTLAHEFGHMLGLPDDYNATDEATKAKLREADPELDDDTIAALSAQGGGGPKFVKSQTAMVDLARRAGVEIPTTFGFDHDTIMDKGGRILPYHLTTVWEALGKATAPQVHESWWKIRT